MSQVAVDHADLALIIALAALTDDRDPTEQTVLERVAERLDTARNRTASNNNRYTWTAWHHGDRVPCTYSTTHPASDRKALNGGELTHRCPCDGSGRVPAFTAKARAEHLTDRWGWSRALDTIRDH